MMMILNLQGAVSDKPKKLVSRKRNGKETRIIIILDLLFTK